MTVQKSAKGILEMGKPVSWVDRGAEGFRVYIDIPLRRNGLPNLAAAQAASKLFESFNPDAFDPIEGVSEEMARARLRDRIEHIETSAESPPVPVFEGDEIPGPRCQSGVCLGD